MKYTVRYAHLKRLPMFDIGETINRGDIIGEMGNTGKSTGAHLHIDCVEGWHNFIYRLSDLENENPKPCPVELNYFMDTELFDDNFEITTWYYDYRYKKRFGKHHPAYDIVTLGKDKIRWNRTLPGTVLRIGNDPGYGNYIMIGSGIKE